MAGASLIATGCEITHYASRGEAHRVRDLLERGTDPNGIEPHATESTLVPLIAASRIGDLEMVIVSNSNVEKSYKNFKFYKASLFFNFWNFFKIR